MSPDSQNRVGDDGRPPSGDADTPLSPPRNGARNPLSTEAIVRAYRRYAPVYDQLFGGILDPGRRALADAVSELRPTSLLEVGVGTGLMLARYPETTAVVGVDLSAEMLANAQARARRLVGRNIRLEQLDAEALPFADGSFDCVTAPYVLSVTPNPQRLVAEIRRVCRVGGTILILNHFIGTRFWWLLERAVRALPGKVGFRSDFELATEISRYDWKVDWTKDVNLFGLSKLVSIRN